MIKRSTEFVYTQIKNTPFSIALASPSSFGRYYLNVLNDRPDDQLDIHDDLISTLLFKDTIDTSIQVYNCTYDFDRLGANLVYEQAEFDPCMEYLFKDTSQTSAVKLDIILHASIYEQFNYSIFLAYPNAVRSAFYGTYSGITYYQPITYFQVKQNFTEPNVEYTFVESPDLFTNKHNKYTYSFEKSYYLRTIEFSDFLRSEFKLATPYVTYFVNETHDNHHDTISATLPVWLDRVPTAVTGVVYDADFFRRLVFNSKFKHDSEEFENICNKSSMLNTTCYLVDEHTIIVLTSSPERGYIVGQPLYKENPWLMMQLESEGYFQLIVPGWY